MSSSITDSYQQMGIPAARGDLLVPLIAHVIGIKDEDCPLSMADLEREHPIAVQTLLSQLAADVINSKTAAISGWESARKANSLDRYKYVSHGYFWVETTKSDRGKPGDGTSKLRLLFPWKKGGSKTYCMPVDQGSDSSSGSPTWGVLNIYGASAAQQAINQQEVALWQEFGAEDATRIPNLAYPHSICAWGDQDTEFGYFVPRANGGDLLDWLWMFPEASSPENMRAVVIGVLQFLADFHEKGFVHGDIKPENILISYKKIEGRAVVDQVMVTDIAHAQRVPEGQKKRFNKGTQGYLAPETFYDRRNFKNWNAKLDIYSAGATLFDIIYGGKLCDLTKENYPQRQFRHNKAMEAHFRASIGNPQGALNSLETLILKMLKLKALERPSAAEALVEAEQIPLEEFSRRPANPHWY